MLGFYRVLFMCMKCWVIQLVLWDLSCCCCLYVLGFDGFYGSAGFCVVF